ncbi:sigma-54-dependent Fis family transcriptional regulator [Tunicatimonas pelagia]|uniref:sigma-54-dependent Fis family transcriptional regulator n=1 Tax=Tunicatimonas pelagia TaxID=931531 RepID=UPI0026657A3B|nr:sigma 54-interacting transcriptional regulator [Tunicatimonas pelagia]WKN44845.1 sigma 54-interacting transcriptional regulator [Tunicatimonas pelagia]
MNKEAYQLAVAINTTIASARNRHTLKKSIVDRLQPIFSFHDIGLFVLSEDRQTLTDWAVQDPALDPSSGNDFHGQLQRHTYAYEGSGLEELAHRISAEGSPLVVSYRKGFFVKHLIQMFGKEGYEHLLREGYDQFLAVVLKNNHGLKGFLFLNYRENQSIPDQPLSLLPALADQLTIAITNIQATEQLREEKQFEETLLSITEPVARVQDRNALFKMIFGKVKKVFPFDEFGLFLLTEDGERHYELTRAEMHEDSTVQSRVEENFGVDALYNHRGTSVEWLMQQGPVTLSFEELDEVAPHPQHQIIMEAEVKQIIGGPLRLSGEVAGMLCFTSKEQSFYKEDDFPLFEALVNQLAVAVSNVLANEQLLEEKKKTEDLLAVTESIANINTGPELVRAIFDKIKKVFPFDDAGLFHLDFENDKERDLVVDYSYDTGVSPEIKDAGVDGWLPMSGLALFLSEKLDIHLPDELFGRFDHPQKRFIEKAGFRHCIAGSLKQGDQTIGLLCFWSKQENAFNGQQLLFKSITDQMSIALSNIIANERLKEEKKKTEDLLSITESIANITKGSELVRSIFDRLQKVFPFDEAGLFHLDFENKRERDLIVDYSYDKTVPNKEIRSSGLSGWLPLSQASQKIAEKTVVLPTETLYEQYDHPHFEYSKKVPLQQVIGGPLYQSQKTIGLLYFWSKTAGAFDHQRPLFQAIADQMSVALSNILAHEDIQRREREEAFKLSLVNALNQRLDWPEKLLNVARLLQNAFPFHLLTLTTADQTLGVPSLGFHQIGADEYRILELPALLKMLSLSPDRFRETKQKYHPHRPTIHNEDDYIRLTQQNPVEQALYNRFGIRSQMTIPLRLGSHKTIDLAFYAREKGTYHTDHLALLQRIAPSLILALEKQLHYQEVLRLNDLIAQENQYLQQEIQVRYNFGEMVGNSTAIQEVFEKIQQVAHTNSNVLITGETGTGKELVARALHQASHRKAYGFVKLNCATLPAELLESELFGHEKGAFTGADKRRIGKFELAHQGTIFLDEIGELPLALQAKLLRVLQEREFERLGGNEIIRPDVRVVVATNRKLTQEVAQHNFRSDLFYRLNVFPIHLPPLRERKEDIPDLAQHFIQKHNKRLGKKVRKLSPPSLQALLSYPWLGNIRELEHVIERAMIIAKDTTLPVVLEKAPVSVSSSESAVPALKTYRQGEIDLIMNTLRYTDGKVSGVGGAAEILDINRATLESKMRKFGIKRAHVVAHRPKEK